MPPPPVMIHMFFVPSSRLLSSLSPPLSSALASVTSQSSCVMFCLSCCCRSYYRSYFERWTKRGMEPSAYHHAPVWRHTCTQACRVYLLAAPRAGLYINVRTGIHGFMFRSLPVKLIQWYIFAVFTLYLCVCTFSFSFFFINKT